MSVNIFRSKFLNKNNKAFSFIDLSVMVVVFSFFAVTVLVTNTNVSSVNREMITMKKLENIKKAMNRYVKTYANYPCPADATLSVTNTNFGVGVGTGTLSADGSAGGCKNAADTFNSYNFVSSDADQVERVVEGMVPVKTLGLMPEDAIDGWGRRIMYAVSYKLTSCNNYDGVPTITVLRDFDSSTAPESQPEANKITSSAAYVLLSYGDDGYGAYTKDGGNSRVQSRDISGGDCATGGNCIDSREQLVNHHLYDDSSTGGTNETQFDRVFIKPGKPLMGEETKVHFDDVVEYDTKQNLGHCKATIGTGTNDMIITSDGNYLLVGYIDPVGSGNGSDFDAIATKLDSSCNVIWSVILGGSYTDAQDNFNGVVEINDGGTNYYILVGQTWSRWGSGTDKRDYSDNNPAEDNRTNGIILKLTTGGSISSAKVFDRSGWDGFTEVYNTSDNMLAVAGKVGLDSGGDFAVLKVAYDINTIQWARSSNMLGHASYNITEVSGAEPGLIATGIISGGDSSYVKFNLTTGAVLFPGNVGYTIRSNGEDSDLNSVIATSDGGFISAGYKSTVTPMEDWVIKVNNSGGVVWSKSTTGNSYIYDIVQLLSGDLIAVGSTNVLHGGNISHANTMKIRESDGSLIWTKVNKYNLSEMSDYTNARNQYFKSVTRNGSGYTLSGNMEFSGDNESNKSFYLDFDDDGDPITNCVTSQEVILGWSDLPYVLTSVSSANIPAFTTTLYDFTAQAQASMQTITPSTATYSYFCGC